VEQQIIKKLEDFFGKYRLQLYKKGEILVRADEEASGIYYIKDGFVKKYAISKKGEELVVNVFKPGSFFPMSRAITGYKNKYFYEAKTPLEARKAPINDVLNFLKSNPDIVYDLLTRIYRGLDGVLMRTVYLMSGSAYSRLTTELILHARRFGKYEKETGKVICKVSEKDLAAQSGLTRETISREMANLKKKGLLEFHANTLIVNNLKKLEEELKDDFNGLP
jgi:CRP/FNR family transcriptional regulator, cyclic AMP receptor protein